MTEILPLNHDDDSPEELTNFRQAVVTRILHDHPDLAERMLPELENWQALPKRTRGFMPTAAWAIMDVRDARIQAEEAVRRNHGQL